MTQLRAILLERGVVMPQGRAKGAFETHDCCAGETPLCAIRIEAKSCSQSRAEEVLLGQPTAWQGKIDMMAAMNKSLARNNKSQNRGKSATAGDDGGALLLLPLKTSQVRMRTARPSWPDLPICGRPG